MLDFNDTQKPAPRGLDAERDAIREALLSRLESVLATLFPAGKKRGGKFLIGDVLGSPGDSLEVVLTGDKTGLWTDRATGDGGDIFSLIAAHLGIVDRARQMIAGGRILARQHHIAMRQRVGTDGATRLFSASPSEDEGPVRA